MKQSIKAILWDFGGVLTSSPFDAFNDYEAQHDLPRDFLRCVNATNSHDNAWAGFESNRIDATQFDHQFAVESHALGHRVQGREVIALLKGKLRPNMVRALEICKQHYLIACITNNVKPPVQQQADGAVVRVMEMFDAVIESSLEGIRKPDPAIYQLACARLSVPESTCIFLDDLGINLKPAKALGMHTIKVLNEHQALQDLAAITGLNFPTVN